MKNMNEMFPDHILEVIFSKIPIIYLPGCRSVCKFWNQLIQYYATSSIIPPNTFFLCTFSTPSLHFIDLDPNRLQQTTTNSTMNSSINSDGDWTRLQILDSCKGLILLLKFRSHPRKEEYGIFNPMTNEYMKLPITKPEEEGATIFNYGFGYSPKTKCYKVARVYFDIELGRTVFEMFIFGGNKQTWNRVDYVAYDVFENGVYFDGALYWIGIDREKRNFIVRLDIDSEQIETTLSLTEANEVFIKVFNGSIYATVLYDYKIEVWNLHRFGGQDSWNKQIVLDMPKTFTAWSFKFQMIKDYEDGETFCLLNQNNFIFFHRKFGKIKPFDKDLSRRFVSIHQIQSINFASVPKIFQLKD